MRILATIAVLITVSTNANADFYDAVTPENITGQAKMKCDSVDIHRRFKDLGNVINCGLYLNPKQQDFYVEHIQGQNMANGWRHGEHSVSSNKLAMADAELQISSPCAVIKLDIPVKPIELSGKFRPYTRRRDNANNVHYTRGQSKGTVKIPHRPKPKQVSKPSNAPKPPKNTYSHYK